MTAAAAATAAAATSSVYVLTLAPKKLTFVAGEVIPNCPFVI